MTDITYTVELFYADPRPHFRRNATHRIDDMTIEVRFDPRMVPRRVWWATWHDAARDSTPLVREPVTLDRKLGCVRKELSSAERSVVGFCWEW